MYLRGAPAAPPSSPILDALQIGGGIMTRNIVLSWDLDHDLDNIALKFYLCPIVKLFNVNYTI